MTDDEALAGFRWAGALPEGQFIPSSGLRSPPSPRCAEPGVIRIVIAGLLALVSVRAELVEARPPQLSQARPSTSSGRTEKETPDQVAVRYGLAGEVMVARGGKVLLERGYGTIRPDGGPEHQAGERWRLASITKQVTAALFLRDMARDGRSLDENVGFPIGEVSWRMLLTHHSGLANPDATPKDAARVPSFYTQPLALAMSHCTSAPGKPNAPFSYNNCDYLLLGSALMGPDMLFRPQAKASLWPKGMAMAAPGEIGVPGFVQGKPEPAFQLGNFSAAGGLIGTARAVFDFDRSLMTGQLLPPAALGALWKPEGNGSYQALGQWVFPGKLKGCAAPKRIVQRDGEIWGVQARNYILPDDDLVVIVFTNRSSEDFAIGEVWEGRGFAYDLLSAAVSC